MGHKRPRTKAAKKRRINMKDVRRLKHKGLRNLLGRDWAK